MRLAPLLYALAVAGAVAGDDLLELAPVDVAETPVPGGSSKLQLGSGNVRPR
jgi:hypothetical protein